MEPGASAPGFKISFKNQRAPKGRQQFAAAPLLSPLRGWDILIYRSPFLGLTQGLLLSCCQDLRR
jgi:hypothetical protein